MEDVSIEHLANTVMKQLARRDILVHDVEIFEFTKKAISFKETKGGVVIKGMKFTLDEEIKVEKEEVKPIDIPQAKSVLRMEYFNPDEESVISELSEQGIKMTSGRKYPIYKEIPSKIVCNIPGAGLQAVEGIDYEIMDDTANFTVVPSIHFSPERKGLFLDNGQRPRGPKLSYMGSEGNSMPDLRGMG